MTHIGYLREMTLTDVVVEKEKILFKISDGNTLKMYHRYECCEDVWVEDIVGDIQDLIGSPILVAEESIGESVYDDEKGESTTWTFYKLATIKGHVDIRWCGRSNGYYSEKVNFLLESDK